MILAMFTTAIGLIGMVLATRGFDTSLVGLAGAGLMVIGFQMTARIIDSIVYDIDQEKLKEASRG